MSEHTPLTEAERKVAEAIAKWEDRGPTSLTVALLADAVYAARDALAARTSTATADTARLRDLTRRLGFGDDVTEPMADNDTIVAWFEEQSRDANEWQESQLWRNDCYAKGHPDDDDCWECDPSLRPIWAEEAATADTGLRERVAEIVARIEHDPRYDDSFGAAGLFNLRDDLDAALATPASTEDRADNEGTR